jgi:hypothetical protein
MSLLVLLDPSCTEKSLMIVQLLSLVPSLQLVFPCKHVGLCPIQGSYPALLLNLPYHQATSQAEIHLALGKYPDRAVYYNIDKIQSSGL